jgi:hypothetical protein
VIEGTRDSPMLNVFCALSGQEVFGHFLFLTQMHSDCCNVPGHVGGIPHTSFG